MELEEGRREVGGLNINRSEITPSSSNLVTNGSVDYQGQTADKTRIGGWKASPFIIMNEVAERMSFYAIGASIVNYLVVEMHEPLPVAANHVTNWIGASLILTLFGAFIADAYLGRFKTILVFCCVYAAGMWLLTLSASLDGLRPPPGLPSTNLMNAVLYGALVLIAFGTGGTKPCIAAFGADQFDETDEREANMKSSFFNWYFFGINMGAILALTVMVYIQATWGWGWGFGLPATFTVVSLLVFVAGIKMYRYQKPLGSPISRFAQVIVAACRNRSKNVQEEYLHEVSTEKSDIAGATKLQHTKQYRFLDKAAMVTSQEDMTRTNRWKLCTVTQVEELKCFIRVLPVWTSTLCLSVSFAQLATFFIHQSLIMDRHLTPNFAIPPPSMCLFTAINPILVIPLYEAFAVPILRKLTGNPRGITSLQRMGVGLFVATAAMASAALVERRRLDEPMSMTAFWLIPQFFLLGCAEVFTYVGALEFYYEEATAGTKSLSTSLFLTQIGLGNFISTALVKIIDAGTGGVEKGWLRNDLNESRLDYFYWILCGINAVSFFVYMPISMAYKGKDAAAAGTVMAEKELTRMNS